MARCDYYGFLIYPDSVVEDWHKRLSESLLPIAISPLHSPRDENKKPHYHGIVQLPHKSGLKMARAMLEGIAANSFLQPLADPAGGFEYLTHENSPDKQQFAPDVLPELLNGFEVPERPLDDDEMWVDVDSLVLDDGLVEVVDVVRYYRDAGELSKAAWVSRHSVQIGRLCDSARYRGRNAR